MSILGFNSNSSHSNSTSSSMLSQNNPPFFHEFKKQASFYFKEKIKTARLALTDVTPAQLMTEEATNGNPWAPDTKTMGLISRSAFEVDDYWRIVEILHRRLASFDKKNWRPSYNSLILLEHLMTHGPESVAKEFQDEKSSISQMQSFHHVDEKGFNWGLTVRKKSERILELLEKRSVLKEERNRARKVTRGIQGFGSFSSRISSANQGILQESKISSSEIFGRSHTQFHEHCNEENNDKNDDSNILPSTDENQTKGKAKKPALVNRSTVDVNVVHGENSMTQKANAKENLVPRDEFHEWSNLEGGEINSLLIGGRDNVVDEDDQLHPFSANEKQSRSSLLGY